MFDFGGIFAKACKNGDKIDLSAKERCQNGLAASHGF